MVNHPEEDEGAAEGDLSVALDTLSAGEGVNPEVGDEVEVLVMGKVTKIEEDRNCAYVTPETLNGEPPPDMGDKESEGDALMRSAEEADEESGY